MKSSSPVMAGSVGKGTRCGGLRHNVMKTTDLVGSSLAIGSPAGSTPRRALH
jgi:hypothetical protein